MHKPGFGKDEVEISFIERKCLIIDQTKNLVLAKKLAQRIDSFQAIKHIKIRNARVCVKPIMDPVCISIVFHHRAYRRFFKMQEFLHLGITICQIVHRLFVWPEGMPGVAKRREQTQAN